MKRLWEAGEGLDALIHAFTVGDDPEVDLAFARWDVVGSMAHVRVQLAAGVLDEADADVLLAGLEGVLADVDAGRFRIPPALEDVHTAVEVLLTERLGPVAGKLHTGRSRNDQVLTDLRLWMRAELAAARGELLALVGALLDWAEAHPEPLTGYTHLQPAMPSSYALWAGGYAGALLDTLPLLDGAARFADRCPLGSAAGYGSPLPLDRALAARLLGFAAVESPVTAPQLTRGAVESAVLGALATPVGLVGRWAWDVSLYASGEFALLALPAAFTTGSSIMPQKRNPDVAELLRATPARVRAARDEIEGMLSLPGGYHRDLQLTKAPLVRGVRAARGALAVAAHLARGLVATPRPLDPVLYAAGDALRRPEPFREAYRAVAAEVKAGRRDFAPHPAPDAGLAELRARLERSRQGPAGGPA